MSGFGIDHLPYGVFSLNDGGPRVGVRFGDAVLDLHLALGRDEFAQPTLNAFLSRGRAAWDRTRAEVAALLRRGTEVIPLADVRMHHPLEVGDYVDFYCSEHHATNVGRILRPDGSALLPNWKHLPVGYHGRAGTVVVSGTDIVRPCGQRLPPGSSQGEPVPEFGPTRRLDIEAELGFVVGTPSRLGSPLGTGDFAEHVFGVVLVNDWSARDIQAWEYQPLGPFLGKSFATSIGAWVTPLAALEGARCDLPGQDPAPLPYLAVDAPAGYDIEVEVLLNGTVVSRPPYSSMYWAPAQMLAHLTANGASVRTGDLFASGTISGPEREQRGSFLELSWGGREPFGEGRTFLEDGDEVTLRATAGPISLAEVTGRVLPAGLA